MTMQLKSLPHPDGLIIRVDEHRLDAAIATAFKDRIRGMIATGGIQIILDLGGVDFMDSSGLGAIIAIYKAMPSGKKLTLTGMTPNVERVFRLTRMDKVLPIQEWAETPASSNKRAAE